MNRTQFVDDFAKDGSKKFNENVLESVGKVELISSPKHGSFIFLNGAAFAFNLLLLNSACL